MASRGLRHGGIELVVKVLEHAAGSEVVDFPSRRAESHAAVTRAVAYLPQEPKGV